MTATTREGPCANPGCILPDTNAGQWTKVPAGFDDEQLRPGHNGCICKRDPCRVSVGLPPLTIAGKKRALEEAEGQSSAPKGTSGRTTHQPCPPFIKHAEQIWALRCAALSRLPARTS